MIGITMRVMRHAYPGGAVEERDALARDWPAFLGCVFPGETFLYLPNTGPQAVALASGARLSGLVFSGGEDWGASPERDETESSLFDWAKKTGLPVFGVCRGAQVINLLMGGNLAPCEQHVATRHGITLVQDMAGSSRHEVNSFHRQCIRPEGLAADLSPLARAIDGSVEAFMDHSGRICGVMWHPEREAAPAALDMALFHSWLDGQMHAC